MHLVPCADQRSALGFNDGIAWQLGNAHLVFILDLLIKDQQVLGCADL